MSDGLTPWIAQLLRDPDMLKMGHAQRGEDQNIGLGWLYYGLARLLRPQRIVVIGSYRGFVPMLFARGLADNGEGGRVLLIDPSLVDDFWTDPARVTAHFAGFDLFNIDHLPLTTQQLADAPQWQALGEVGLAMIDGYHSAEQAALDHAALRPKLTPDALVLFHDSIRERVSRIYGDDRPYTHTVARYVDVLRRDPAWQVLDFASGDGLSIVRHIGATDG
ncbi:MAG: class I SAM-dependent methyltransferase [Sphingopyxis sp.]|nr:class I SAM-dependent methyltransferase [Sphingopyxis sp.]